MRSVPDELSIGKASYAYNYTHQAAILVCSRGSDDARADEKLILMQSGEHLIAYDATVMGDASIELRKPVFRCLATSIPLCVGWHEWQCNHAASVTATSGAECDWRDGLWAETRHSHV